jgi:hypothetical protein
MELNGESGMFKSEAQPIDVRSDYLLWRSLIGRPDWLEPRLLNPSRFLDY